MSCQLLIEDEVVHPSPGVVLFDKDGTLIDIHHYWASMIRIRSEWIVERWFSGAQQSPRIAIDLQEAMGVDTQAWRMKPDGPVGIKPRPFIVDVAASVVRENGQQIDNEQMEALFKEVDESTAKEMLPLLKILPGVEELLESLKRCGIQSLVVSTDITSRARKAMETLQLDHFFAEILGGDMVENTKPAVDLAELALEYSQCDVESAVVIGDHPVDIKMGVNANIDTNIGVLTGLSDQQAFDDLGCWTITNLKSIEVVCSDAVK